MKENTKPKITIITSTYNAASFLEGSIKSVIEQTYTNKEYIIIDGGSQDDTLSILKKYDSDIDFWISESDSGIYDAWNKGLLKSTGDWIVFIGADDEFIDKNVLMNVSTQLSSAEKEGTRFVYGETIHAHRSSGKIIGHSKCEWNTAKKKFLKIMPIIHSGAFHSSQLFKELGNFNSNFKIAGDYEFLLREFKDFKRNAKYLKDTSVLMMREGGVSSDLKFALKMTDELKKARKVNDIQGISMPIAIFSSKIHALYYLNKVIGKKNYEAIRKIFHSYFKKIKS